MRKKRVTLVAVTNNPDSVTGQKVASGKLRGRKSNTRRERERETNTTQECVRHKRKTSEPFLFRPCQLMYVLLLNYIIGTLCVQKPAFYIHMSFVFNFY